MSFEWQQKKAGRRQDFCRLPAFSLTYIVQTGIITDIRGVATWVSHAL